MDPALRELLRDEPADRVVEAIIRFRRPGVQLPGVGVVARFGPIATCRIRLAAVGAIRAHPDVVSLKSARPLGPEHAGNDNPAPPSGPFGEDEPGPAAGLGPRRRPIGEPLTGRGVVVGVVDWGLDVDHPNLKHADGSTRLLALWDQRSRRHRRRPPGPYGYGVVHTRDDIDRALRTASPFRTLGYHPSDADRSSGAHGTHVTDIAAGNGRRGQAGVAPGAELVFVHLADRDTGGLANLGDSVRLLEAVDFIARTAGERPWVINLSMGRHGGPHDGTTLVELAIDALLAAAPGRFVTQSAGNYHQARAHATGVVRTGERRVLRFVTDPRDRTPNELEIWYDGDDELAVRIDPPGRSGPVVLLGDTADIVAGRDWGRIYHRAHDPNNGDHQVDVFIDPSAPAGEWRVTLEGRRVRNGRFHAWLERDEACRRCQAQFLPADAASDTTTGTIANGRLPLVLAAYDARSGTRPPGRSSSAGPTRDERHKPDAAAPGVGVVAARSAPRGSARSPGLLTAKTGTSMAAPHAAGAIALCLEHAGPRLGAADILRLVLATTDAPAHPAGWGERLGHGYLNIPALLTELRRTHPPGSEDTMEPTEISALALAPARAYRELLYRPSGGLSTWLDGRFTVLARPGQRPVDLQVGDVILDAVLGGPRERGDCVVVTERGLVRHRGNRPDRPAGWYVATTSPDAEARSRRRRRVRVLDPAGVVPPGQVLLRARPPAADPLLEPPGEPEPEPGLESAELGRGLERPEEAIGDCGCGCTDRGVDVEEESPSEPGPWTGTAEQEDFRARVLAEHIWRSSRARGAPQRDLRDDELADVLGTCDAQGRNCVRTATTTAAAAGRLLAAANADLATAQAAGHPDALRTVRLRATSGYRGSDHQRRLWRGYFANKYYDATRAARGRIADGPHSDAAVDHMLRSKGEGGYGITGRIAAPGFSNHQGGIAIDLWQDRTKGHGIANDSDDAARCRWRSTWFHGWLRTHAAAHGLRPIPTEEWHWEHRPDAPVTPDLSGHRGGKLWTFASAALPHPIAVFVPKAALGRREVDVLVFAHGLLGGCTRPKTVPAGLVTDAPFELGRVVDAAQRPVVLVVPLLDWGNPCGGAVFGRGHDRWHPLGSPAVLNAVVGETLAEVGRLQSAAAPVLRELVVAGHSRAYDVLEPLAASRNDPAMRQGALARLSQVWAFDTTYAGDVTAWKDWLRLNPTLRLRVYYRPGSRTGTVGDRFHAGAGDRLAVTRVEEGHCAVPATRLAQLLPPPAAPAAPAPAPTLPGAADEAAGGTALDPDLSATLGLSEEAGGTTLDPDLSATLGLPEEHDVDDLDDLDETDLDETDLDETDFEMGGDE